MEPPLAVIYRPAAMLVLIAMMLMLVACSTNPGDCKLPPEERADVCGWPPFWER